MKDIMKEATHRNHQVVESDITKVVVLRIAAKRVVHPVTVKKILIIRASFTANLVGMNTKQALWSHQW
jgi:alpha-ketoglutarate-dependent taurine dioxygenase